MKMQSEFGMVIGLLIVCVILVAAQQDTTKQIDERQGRYLQNTSPVVDLKRRVELEEQKLRRMIQDEIRKLQGEILTTYSPDGEPVFQSQDSKGWHRQFGGAKLVNGLATINLNSSPSEGKQDVSFMADSTYRGVAWSLDSANTKTYWIIPLSATEVLVKSSDNTDTATVRFLLEGI